MVNSQTTSAAKLKRVERKAGAKATGDPDGVLAVLQTARRLLADGGELCKDTWQERRGTKKSTIYSALGALRAGVDLAHPLDRSRAAWAAQAALQSALNKDKSAPNGIAHLPVPVITRWESHPDTTLVDVLRVYDAAIKAQGTVNIAQSKAKGRK